MAAVAFPLTQAAAVLPRDSDYAVVPLIAHSRGHTQLIRVRQSIAPDEGSIGPGETSAYFEPKMRSSCAVSPAL